MDNSNLRRIREVNWAEIEAEETRLLREMTVEQGIHDYLALRREFQPMLEETESIFRLERDAHSIQLQQRLWKLNEWKGNQMDSLVEALVQLQTRLEGAGIPSAAIGGLAVGAWGKARLTRDADLKILLRREDRKRLLDLLKPDYHPIAPDPDSALRNNGILYVHSPGGLRIDIFLADIEFDEMLIRRAQLVELLPGYKIHICSAEDLIVLKVIASRPQDQVDVAGIIQRQGDKLDEDYILDWLSKFEKALDDSTLIRTYEQLKERYHYP
ncbi:MAG: nucleotidyltransferase [Chloroflexota bacterium]